MLLRLSIGNRCPYNSAVSIPENKPFGRGRLERSFYFSFQQGCNKSLIRFSFTDQEKCRCHTPHLVPEKTLGFYFKKNKTLVFPNTDLKDIPLRVFVPDPGKVREIMAADKKSAQPAPSPLYQRESLRNNTGTSWTLHHTADETPESLQHTRCTSSREGAGGSRSGWHDPAHLLRMRQPARMHGHRDRFFLHREILLCASQKKDSVAGMLQQILLQPCGVLPASASQRTCCPDRIPGTRASSELHTPGDPFDLSPCVVQRLAGVGAQRRLFATAGYFSGPDGIKD